MFEKIIVSLVNYGKPAVHTYRNITKIYSDNGYMLISNGTYTWQFKIDRIVSIVIV